MKYKFLVFILLFLGLLNTYAQAPYFEKTYPESGADVAFSIQQLADSSLYLGGFSEQGSNGQYDFALKKVTPDGNLIWSKNYGTIYNDQALGMCRADSTNLMMIGTTEDPNNQLSTDVLLIKIDSAGNELWRHTYGGPQYEQAKWVQQIQDGGYIFCGFAPDLFGSIDTYIVRIDSTGTQLWESFIGGAHVESGDRIISVPGGDFIVASTTTNNGNSDVRLSRIDQNGIVVWDTITGDSLQCGSQGVLLDSHLRLIVFGETEISPFSKYDYFIQAFDLNGRELWRKTFGGGGTNALFDLKEDQNGDFIGTGYSNSIAGSSSPLNVSVIKVDSAANLIWAREYGFSGIDIGYSLLISQDQSIYIGGRSTQMDDDFYFLHLNQNGLLSLHENESEEGIVLYPNPVNYELSIIWDKKIKSWNIYNAFGKPVYSMKTADNENTTQLDTQKFGNGLYLLNAKMIDGTMVCKKIVINH